MASQLFELPDVIAELRECSRRGDWQGAHKHALALRLQMPPPGGPEIGEYLNRLREALVVAKTSRAHMASTLVRLNAAGAFHRIRASAPGRQEFGEPPD